MGRDKVSGDVFIYFLAMKPAGANSVTKQNCEKKKKLIRRKMSEPKDTSIHMNRIVEIFEPSKR